MMIFLVLCSIVFSPYLALEGNWAVYERQANPTGYEIYSEVFGGDVGISVMQSCFSMEGFLGAGTTDLGIGYEWGFRGGAVFSNVYGYIGVGAGIGREIRKAYLGVRSSVNMGDFDVAFGIEGARFHAVGEGGYPGEIDTYVYSLFCLLGHEVGWFFPCVFLDAKYIPLGDFFSVKIGVGASFSHRGVLKLRGIPGARRVVFQSLVLKPNIYVYPTEPCEVEVRVIPNGKITKADPPYEDGWRISAFPDGRLEGTPGYLFYEASLNLYDLPDRGWCVEAGDVMEFFAGVLRMYGFNTKEISDFVDWWDGRLPNAKYYVIYPLVNEDLDRICPLEVTPSPRNMLRVWFIIKPVGEFEEISPPRVVSARRDGFFVAEWGVILE